MNTTAIRFSKIAKSSGSQELDTREVCHRKSMAAGIGGYVRQPGGSRVLRTQLKKRKARWARSFSK
jgi:hypothetical protein